TFKKKVNQFNTKVHDVKYLDETYKIDEVNQHIKQADFVVSILPSTAETRGLVGKDFFENINDDSVFLNIGRGDLITDETLKYVLDNKVINHLILDVFNNEPLESDSFVYQYDNITVTPHASARTDLY